MNILNPTYRRALFVFGVLAMLIPGVTSLAHAQCVYADLESDTPYLSSPPSGVENIRFNQTKTNWMAIAARPTTTNNPLIWIYQSAAAYPTCLTGLLEDDWGIGEVSVVVGNFNEEPLGIYYGLLDEIDPPEAVPVEWDDGNGSLAVNDSALIRSMGANDVVDIWDVFLETGHTYGFDVSEISGDGLSLLIFRDPGPATNWSGRDVAVLDEELTGAMAWYTPQSRGDYAVVVVKDSPDAATYGIAFGECVTPSPIQSGVPVHPYGFQNYYEVNQQWWGWTAVAMLSDNRIDDLWVYGSATGSQFPDCFTGPLIWTNGHTGVVARNFVDGGGPLPGLHYVRAAPAVGSRDPALEWEGQGGELTVNGPPAIHSVGSHNLVDVWGVDLVSGEVYTVHQDQLRDAHAFTYLFPPADAGWVADFNAFPIGSRTDDYTAAVSGNHGIVATLTAGYRGERKIGVSTCGEPLVTNGAPTTYLIPSGQTSDRFSFKALGAVWVGVAVTSDANWDLDVYEHPCGSPEPICFSNLLKSSTDANRVDFIVGDFNRNPSWRNFVHARYVDGTPSDAHFQWPTGRLLVPEKHEFRQLNPPHVIEVFDAAMIAGHEYQIYFEEYFSPDGLRLFVFEPSGDAYWARRGEQVLEATSSTTFTPSITGSYGIAVINETSESITYEIGISSATVSAQAGLTPAGIHSLIPNPTTGSMTIQFGVTNPQPVAFEVVDVAGRVVARLPVVNEGTGTRTQSWNGVGSNGNRPAAGVYFIRMKSGETVVDLEKFVLLK